MKTSPTVICFFVLYMGQCCEPEKVEEECVIHLQHPPTRKSSITEIVLTPPAPPKQHITYNYIVHRHYHHHPIQRCYKLIPRTAEENPTHIKTTLIET